MDPVAHPCCDGASARVLSPRFLHRLLGLVHRDKFPNANVEHAWRQPCRRAAALRQDRSFTAMQYVRTARVSCGQDASPAVRTQPTGCKQQRQAASCQLLAPQSHCRRDAQR